MTNLTRMFGSFVTGLFISVLSRGLDTNKASGDTMNHFANKGCDSGWHKLTFLTSFSWLLKSFSSLWNMLCMNVGTH